MADAAIVLEHVSLAFRAVQALDDVSCEFPAETVVALAGPDGAGKTSIMRLAVGLARAHEGRIEVLGRHLPDQAAALRSHVGYLPQRIGVLGHLTVRENLEYFGALNGVPRGILRERIARLLYATGLETFQGRLARHLSGGMRQKLALACAVLHGPELVLLDEPSTGLDPISRRDLWELIYAFHAEGGGVVVATPSWEEAARCQWVIILDRGRVLAAGEPSGLAQTAQGHVWELATQSLTEETLTSLPWVASARRRGSLVRIISDQRVDSQAVSMALSQVVRGSEARPVEPTLEDAMILLMYSTRARGTATGHGVAGI